jgi:hypothetical protein
LASGQPQTNQRKHPTDKPLFRYHSIPSDLAAPYPPRIASLNQNPRSTAKQRASGFRIHINKWAIATGHLKATKPDRRGQGMIWFF